MDERRVEELVELFEDALSPDELAKVAGGTLNAEGGKLLNLAE